MSNAITVSIGNEIVDLVKTVPGAECAVFDLVPDFTLEQVRQRRIVAAPQAYIRGNKDSASRAHPDETVKINIAVMEKCKSVSELPDLLALTEQIAAAIDRQVITSGIITNVEFDPIYDAQNFRQMKVFIAVCTATVKVIR